MKLRLYQIDSFTKEKFRGNPASVVTNADGLNVRKMQQIAREMNNSETAFVFPGVSGEYDVQVRFFTPQLEVPMCGHATIAAHYALAHESQSHSKTVRQKIQAGVLPVETIHRGNDYLIKMTQGEVEYHSPIEKKTSEELCSALGAGEGDLLPDAPIQVVSTGHSKVFVPFKSFDRLISLRPDPARLLAISRRLQCNGYLAFTLENPYNESRVCARMFAPALGISEDPVNGSSGGALGAYLLKHGLIVPEKRDGFCFDVFQGFALGREGQVRVEVSLNRDGSIRSTAITGQAVIVYRTDLEI